MAAAYKDYRRRPRLVVPGASYTLTALSDPTCNLLPNTCVVVDSGNIQTGPVAVWRCPCQTAIDIELWEAVAAPETMTCLPNNSVICSALGTGVSKMAGGDYDGDLIMVSFCHELVSFVRETHRSIDNISYNGILDMIVTKLGEAANTKDGEPGVEQRFKYGGAERVQEYVNTTLQRPTPHLRGQMCVRAEKVAHLAITSERPLEDRTLILASTAALVSHKAMDVPKKHKGRHVRELMNKMFKRYKIKLKRDSKRSTEMIADKLRPALDDVNSSRFMT